MNPRTDRITRLILVAAAIIGWSLAILLFTRTATLRGAADPAAAARVSSYLTDRVAAMAAGSAYERVEPYLTGDALAAFRAVEQAAPGPYPRLALGEVKTTVLWRAADQAMVEASFSTTNDGPAVRTLEHELLVLGDDGIWRISASWRVVPDPGGPLVGVDDGSDLLPSAAPSPTASPAP